MIVVAGVVDVGALIRIGWRKALPVICVGGGVIVVAGGVDVGALKKIGRWKAVLVIGVGRGACTPVCRWGTSANTRV